MIKTAPYERRTETQQVNYMALPGVKNCAIKMKGREDALEIIKKVCGFYDIPESLLRGKTRRREIHDPRKLTIKLIRMRTRLSLKKIGLLFSRDHTTMINALKQINGLLENNETLREDYEQIRLLL